MKTNCAHMSIVNIDDRGRITIPPEIRDKVGSKRFLAHIDGDGIHLVPLPDPRSVRGSVKIPWTDEELEEAAESEILKRS